nr:hypothetical protein [Tanacetum cinerariifolium]
MVDMNLYAILMIGRLLICDDDIVGFGGAALSMWCLQPWRVGYPFTPSRTRNSETNNFLNKRQHCHLMLVSTLGRKLQVSLELGWTYYVFGIVVGAIVDHCGSLKLCFSNSVTGTNYVCDSSFSLRFILGDDDIVAFVGQHYERGVCSHGADVDGKPQVLLEL